MTSYAVTTRAQTLKGVSFLRVREFATEGEALHLTREGGHSHRRIVHVADATGYAIQQALEAATARHPNIMLVPDMVPFVDELLLGLGTLLLANWKKRKEPGSAKAERDVIDGDARRR